MSFPSFARIINDDVLCKLGIMCGIMYLLFLFLFYFFTDVHFLPNIFLFYFNFVFSNYGTLNILCRFLFHGVGFNPYSLFLNAPDNITNSMWLTLKKIIFFTKKMLHKLDVL